MTRRAFQLYTAMDAMGLRWTVICAQSIRACCITVGVFVTVDYPNTGNREKTFGSQWSDSQDDVCNTHVLLTNVCVWLRVSELAANAGFPPDRSGIASRRRVWRSFCTTMS